MLKASCPNGHQIQAPDQFAGQQARCPKCQALFSFPDPQSNSQGEFDDLIAQDEAIPEEGPPLEDDWEEEPVQRKSKSKKSRKKNLPQQTAGLGRGRLIAFAVGGVLLASGLFVSIWLAMREPQEVAPEVVATEAVAQVAPLPPKENPVLVQADPPITESLPVTPQPQPPVSAPAATEVPAPRAKFDLPDQLPVTIRFGLPVSKPDVKVSLVNGPPTARIENNVFEWTPDVPNLGRISLTFRLTQGGDSRILKKEIVSRTPKNLPFIPTGFQLTPNGKQVVAWTTRSRATPKPQVAVYDLERDEMTAYASLDYKVLDFAATDSTLTILSPAPVGSTMGRWHDVGRRLCCYRLSDLTLIQNRKLKALVKEIATVGSNSLLMRRYVGAGEVNQDSAAWPMINLNSYAYRIPEMTLEQWSPLFHWRDGSFYSESVRIRQKADGLWRVEDLILSHDGTQVERLPLVLPPVLRNEPIRFRLAGLGEFASTPNPAGDAAAAAAAAAPASVDAAPPMVRRRAIGAEEIAGAIQMGMNAGESLIPPVDLKWINAISHPADGKILVAETPPARTPQNEPARAFIPDDWDGILLAYCRDTEYVPQNDLHNSSATTAVFSDRGVICLANGLYVFPMSDFETPDTDGSPDKEIEPLRIRPAPGQFVLEPGDRIKFEITGGKKPHKVRYFAAIRGLTEPLEVDAVDKDQAVVVKLGKSEQFLVNTYSDQLLRDVGYVNKDADDILKEYTSRMNEDFASVFPKPVTQPMIPGAVAVLVTDASGEVATYTHSCFWQLPRREVIARMTDELKRINVPTRPIDFTPRKSELPLFDIVLPANQSLVDLCEELRLDTKPTGDHEHQVSTDTKKEAVEIQAAYMLLDPVQPGDSPKLKPYPDENRIRKYRGQTGHVVSVSSDVLELQIGRKTERIPFFQITPADRPRIWTDAFHLYRERGGLDEDSQFAKIGAALREFHAEHNVLPPRALVNGKKQPLLSWRVLILPYLGQWNLYCLFHLNEPWDSPHNRKLIEYMPLAYSVSQKPLKPGMTTVLGLQGKRFAFPPDRLRQFTLEPRMVVCQVSDEQACEWTKPSDWDVDMAGHPYAKVELPEIRNCLYSDGAIGVFDFSHSAPQFTSVRLIEKSQFETEKDSQP